MNDVTMCADDDSDGRAEAGPSTPVTACLQAYGSVLTVRYCHAPHHDGHLRSCRPLAGLHVVRRLIGYLVTAHWQLS